MKQKEEFPEVSEEEDILIESRKKENTIWKILMPGKNKKLATKAEL